MRRFVQEGRLPHLLFYGPPGTGKTSTAVSLAGDIFGRTRAGMVLELNASDERGIGVVRDQIKTFAATKTLNFRPGDSSSSSSAAGFKIIILDECDAMTGPAQNALRRVMERYVRNVRFILICNYVGQIIPALQSRCTRFRFSPLPAPVLQQQIAQVALCEHIVVDARAAQAVIRLAHGDMRKILNVLQAAAAAGGRTAPISEEIVYGVTAAPLPADLDRLFRTLLDQTDYSSALSRTPPHHHRLPFAVLRSVVRDKGLALADLVGAFFERLAEINVPDDMRIFLTKHLADIEYAPLPRS